MITIAECTELPSSFDGLFEQSLPILEAGTFDWRYLGSPSDNASKKIKMREVYEEYIEVPNCKVIYWEKDGHPIHIAAGRIEPDDTDYIMWNYALYGGDKEGSKSWLHDSSYISETKTYIKNTLGLLGYTISCNKDSSIYNYHMNKVDSSSNYTVSLEKTLNAPLAPEKTIAIIRFTYT